MNLEPVTQSEVNQKEKNEYHTLMDIYGLQRLVSMNLVAGRDRDADTQNGLISPPPPSGGRKEWDERRKQHQHINTTMCEIDSWGEVTT